MPYPITRRRLLVHSMAGASALAVPPWLHAQTSGKAERWPTSNIKLIAPYPAGGGVDITCRKLAEMLAPRIGVPVIVQNTAGAAGLIGSKAIAAAKPDGGTFGYVHSGIVTLQAMGAKIDMLKDFTPVAPRIQASSFLILVHPGSPYRSLQELIAAMKADPQKLSCGTTGPGSPEHMIFERLVKAVPGVGALNVPFKGAIEGVAALMGKQIDFMVGLTSAARGAVESGKLRALANPGARRSRLFPDVPTVAEAGVAGFVHSTWGGIFGPKGLPPHVVEHMRIALNQIARTPEYTSFVINIGSEPVHEEESADAFRSLLTSTLEAETELVNQLGLKI